MKNYSYIIMMGIILVIAGILILVLAAESTGSFFFIFPFFFYGDFGSSTPFIIGVVVLFSIICLFQILSLRPSRWVDNESITGTRKCISCQISFPSNFNYCPICGKSAVREDRSYEDDLQYD